MKTLSLITLIALNVAVGAVAAERPTDLIAADLGIPEQVFIDCFSGVSPDRDHNPSGTTQRMNKAVLLPCLQKATLAITNDGLDTVMDRYRPEGPMNR